MSSPPPLGALRASPLVEQAAERLRAQITAGNWPVGTKLPGETTLAKELGVGRSTVREAVRALAGQGLLRPRQGAGVFVVATEAAEDWPTRLRRAAVTDVYEVRAMVEVQAARLAAARRTDADLAALDTALAGRTAAAEADDAAFVDADIALHSAVVAAAHNPVLTDLYERFVPALREGLVELVSLLGLRDHTPDHGAERHTALVAAVRAGDADLAAGVLQAEIAATVALLRK
ncbi:FCD domain-containing protein [Streptomyces sp. NBC_01387]|uniref:FadR/GntR family transcriptional regulator n=1 Tax=unclassified Streptomyces TaxID=2593676 RepID=UPI002250646E|nr:MULTISPECIES: FCD domain-containing protein [unclassified Streptomyces]MCX4548530.1 FCD domain-containing protein [Streptomyces sp. NBC_01500]WSC20143.1 FCD domain-containing protein [Streptomyces sp. NBC_01766]